MKKVLPILLVLALGVSMLLTGCGGGNDAEGEDGGDAVTPELTVGYIFIGDIKDGGFTQGMYEGAMAAEAKFDGKVTSKYIENVSDGDKQASYDAALNLIDQGCNVIVGCSFGFMYALDELANSGDYDNVTFLHFSGYMANDTNFDNFFGSMEQARYLTGMVAGAMTETNVLGYVAAFNLTEVNIGINSFTLGAQAVNPDVEVKVVYINTWSDAEKEKAAAEQLCEAGSDVIAYHSDHTSPQIAAEEAGAYCIGWNYPQNDAPNSYLTAAIWNTEAYFEHVYPTIMDGTFKPESYYGTMQEGMIELADMTDLVPADVQQQVTAVKEKMLTGEFSPLSGKIEFTDGTLWCDEGQTLTREEIWPSELKLVKGVTSTSAN